ncbi:MAG TPA: hypothetical protein DIT66_06680 [Rhodobiaceae bacterium]|nr:hypothetical protein [Rhodobiaceae bacterium]
MELVLTDLCFEINGDRVVDRVSAKFPAGQVIGILGPNGAGKTTLLRLVAGLLAPSAGCVDLCDPSVAFNDPAMRARHIGYLPQHNVAAWPVVVRDLVALGGLANETHGDAVRASGVKADKIGEVVTNALAVCEADYLADRVMTELSGGEQARVFLARLLATQADILLLDEPVKMLDPAHQLKTMSLLRQLAAEGRSVVVVMHDLNLALRYCDQVMLMRDGVMRAQGAPRDVFTTDGLQRIFGLDVSLVAHQGHHLVHPLRATEVHYEPDRN